MHNLSSVYFITHLYVFRVYLQPIIRRYKGKAVPVTGLEWPRGFQEVNIPRFLDNGTGWW
jgi:hypothetical protein